MDFNTTKSNFFTSVANGIVYVGGGSDSMFYALNATSGAVVWKHKISAIGFAVRCPSVVNNTVYMQGDDSVFAFNGSTGAVIWKEYVPNDNNYFSSPTVANGKIYISSDSLYCFNTNDGSRAWAFRDAVKNLSVSGNVFVDGNAVYAAFFDVYYKLNANTGTVYPGWGIVNTVAATDFIVSANNLLIIPGNDPANLIARKASDDAAVWSVPFNDRNSNDWCAPISVSSNGKIIYPTLSGMQP